MFFFWKRVKRVILAFTRSQSVATILDMFTHRMVQTIQLDALLCVGFIALQCYANWSDLTPFVLLLFWRGRVVSFYDNAYHYGTDPHDGGPPATDAGNPAPDASTTDASTTDASQDGSTECEHTGFPVACGTASCWNCGSDLACCADHALGRCGIAMGAICVPVG